MKETLFSVQNYASKKRTVKKSDLTMKYSVVCEVLSTRLKEVLKVSDGVKGNILAHIEQTKQHFLKWS